MPNPLAMALFGQGAQHSSHDGHGHGDGLFGGPSGGLTDLPPIIKAAVASRLSGQSGYGSFAGGAAGGIELPSMECEDGTYECGRSMTEQVFVGGDGRPQFQGGPMRNMIDKAPIFCHPGSENCGVHVNYHVYLNPKPMGGIWERELGEAKVLRARRGPPVVCAPGSDCGGRSQIIVHNQDASEIRRASQERSSTYTFVIHGASVETLYVPFILLFTLSSMYRRSNKEL
ncbi:uncharacterized protein LOC144349226 [Saccoglossus kowalevskii]